MCNEYQQHASWKAYTRLMQAVSLDIPTQQTELDLTTSGQDPKKPDAPFDQHRGFRIGDICPIVVLNDDRAELVPMKWGLVPSNPKAGPVFNFVTEKRHFANSKRCVIPATGFYEFTGKSSPKTKYLFTLNDEPILFIAGIYRQDDDGPPRFTMLTTSPGDDIKPYHDRQIVIFHPDQIEAWLRLSQHESDLLTSLPAGSLTVEMVRQGKDFGKNLFDENP